VKDSLSLFGGRGRIRDWGAFLTINRRKGRPDTEKVTKRKRTRKKQKVGGVSTGANI